MRTATAQHFCNCTAGQALHEKLPKNLDPCIRRLLLDGRDRGGCSAGRGATDFVTSNSAGAFCASASHASPLSCPGTCAFNSSRLAAAQCRGVRTPPGLFPPSVQMCSFMPVASMPNQCRRRERADHAQIIRHAWLQDRLTN